MRRWVYYKDLILVLISKEMKVRYKNTILGFFWSIANPLCFALVFFIAFKVYMRIQIENYIIFLLSGLFPWQWFGNTVNSSPGVFIGNANLIKKVNFPRIGLPLAILGNDLVHFLLSIPVLVIFLLIYKKHPQLIIWSIGIPLLCIIQSLMVLGFSLAVSSLNLFFRDLQHLTVIITNLIFYFTPIIYAETMVPAKYRPLLLANPLSSLIISWQDLFLKNILRPSLIFVACGWAIVIFFVGYSIYKSLEPKFVEVV